MMPTPDELTGRVLARLAPKPAPALSPEPPAEPLAAALAAILAQARAAAAALSAELGPGALDDRNHYDYLAANLAKIAGFQSFSLAEYAYHLPDGRNPGVRLWLEERRWQRRVEVLLFPEVGRWQVDAAGRKVNRLLLTLWPQGDAPRPEPGPGLEGHYPAGETWSVALVRALCLPVLPLL
ncbi:hypothetical protein [Desulfoferula mesophila]|uniref:Uncharacterized protein n=1 Tax=Desulfoferula mesophila TaxID=3058419 RepID=A0AAU9EUF5_9BACT|nr:hypothetical protein FAK_38000 [Desulfoferula mesophilus]